MAKEESERAIIVCYSYVTKIFSEWSTNNLVYETQVCMYKMNSKNSENKLYLLYLYVNSFLSARN